MAKAEELDLDTAKNAASAGKKRGKLILIIVVSVLLVSGSVVGALYFTGFIGGKKSASKADKTQKSADKHKEASKDADAQNKPALYLPLQPALVANFEDPHAGAAFLQLEMQIMSRDQHALDLAKEHMPLIRNNLLLIMSSQKAAELKTRAGKEQLQKMMLESVQQSIATGMSQHANAGDGHDKDKDGDKKSTAKHAEKADEKKTDKSSEHATDHASADGPTIEAVYFTSFIMQ